MGNKLKKQLIKYDLNEEINLMRNIKKIFSENNFENLLEDSENNIIFILGLPDLELL